MHVSTIVARVLDRPGSLERVIGLLRRRGFARHSLSLGREDGGAWHLVVRVERDDRLGDRVRAALESVVDVESVRVVERPREMEMVIAGTWPDVAGGEASPPEFRVITGSPGEVEDALERLRRSGTLRWSVRTGALVPPSPFPAGRGPSSPYDNQREWNEP